MAEDPRTTLQQTDPREAIQEVVRAIMRHRARVVFTTLVFGMLGYALTLVWPAKFESATSFIMHDTSLVTSSAARDALAALSDLRKLEALKAELRSRKRIDAVMNELQWPEWLETSGRESDRRELVVKFVENLVVEMDRDVTGSYNIRLAFRWTSPRKAADFVNRLRDSWIQLTLEGTKKTLEEDKERAAAVLREREAAYADALQAVRNYERENKVPSLLNEDTNNELKAQWLLKQGEASSKLEAAVGEIARLNAELASLPREIPAPVSASTPEQAQALAALNAAKAQLDAATHPVTGFTERHSRRIKAQQTYDAAAAAVAALGVDLSGGTTQMQTNPVYFALGEQLKAAQTLEASLRAELRTAQTELAAIQSNLDALPVVRQELERLATDVDVAKLLVAEQKAVVQPLAEKVLALRAQTLGADSRTFGAASAFEILETGVEPNAALLPIGAIIMAVSVLLGLAVGALGPVLAEMTRGSFGTVREVGKSLGVPVLGAVDLILTTRDLRARAVQRALTWATMALVLASMATALFIYKVHPDVLPSALLRTLRDVKMALT